MVWVLLTLTELPTAIKAEKEKGPEEPESELHSESTRLGNSLAIALF